MKQNTKSTWNATQDMKIKLTKKQMSWMCRRLQDVMWDVRAARSMWVMSSVASGSWVLIKLKMSCACHKYRKSNTWWEVDEMILACNLQVLKIDPWNKGCFFMLPWEEQPMHENQFFLVPEGTGQLNYTCNNLLSWEKKMSISGRELGWMLRRIPQFMGKAVDHCPELHNF